MAFSDTPTNAPQLLPGLDEHTSAVMSELGMTETEIASLQAHSESVREEMYAELLGST